MSKLIKRKDGSYSKRGLWDNIRKNKGSGKKPTKEMLKQESKIKKEENMKSMYKKGGKKMKGESFMEESKEIGFGAPGVKPPKRRFDLGGLMDKDKPKEQPTAPKPTGLGNAKGLPLPTPPSIPDAVSSRQSVVGPGSVMQNAGKGTSVGTIVPKKRGGVIETGMEANARKNRFEGEATIAGKKKYEAGGRKTGDPLKQANITAASDNTSVSTAPKPTGPSKPSSNLAAAQREQKMWRDADKANAEYVKKEDAKKAAQQKKMQEIDAQLKKEEAERASKSRIRQRTGGVKQYKKGGFPDLNGDKEITFGDVLKGRLKGEEGKEKMMGGKMYKKGGKKTMEPGGGGRFAKMVSGLKKEGKSEDSAKAIAASIGRKKYGKSKFQEMAAAGKKKMMGGKKC
jgi:hypothetical protein